MSIFFYNSTSLKPKSVASSLICMNFASPDPGVWKANLCPTGRHCCLWPVQPTPFQQDRRPCSTNRMVLWFMAVMHELISVTLIRFSFKILMVCILRCWIFLEKTVATDANLPGKFYDFIECKFLGWKCIHHGNLFGCPLYKALLPEGGLSGIG